MNQSNNAWRLTVFWLLFMKCLMIHFASAALEGTFPAFFTLLLSFLFTEKTKTSVSTDSSWINACKNCPNVELFYVGDRLERFDIHFSSILTLSLAVLYNTCWRFQSFRSPCWAGGLPISCQRNIRWASSNTQAALTQCWKKLVAVCWPPCKCVLNESPARNH